MRPTEEMPRHGNSTELDLGLLVAGASSASPERVPPGEAARPQPRLGESWPASPGPELVRLQGPSPATPETTAMPRRGPPSSLKLPSPVAGGEKNSSSTKDVEATQAPRSSFYALKFTGLVVRAQSVLGAASLPLLTLLGIASAWSQLGPRILSNYPPLDIVAGSMWAAMNIVLVGGLPSVHRVTRPGGSLDRLRANTVLVGAMKDSLEKWAVAMNILSMVFFASGFALLVQGMLSPDGDGADIKWTVNWKLSGGPYVMFIAVPCVCWWYALKVASMLVRSKISVALAAIQETDPNSAEWTSVVAPLVTSLITETLPILSTGWGDGLAVGFVISWLTALGCFSYYLCYKSVSMLFYTVAMLLLPILLALDVAGASAACVSLQNALNSKRTDNITPETHVSIWRLETALERCNAKQGLGFVVAGKVIDTATLKTMFFTILSLATTVGPILFALNQSFEESIENCVPSPIQIAVVKAAFAETTNATCSYTNLTVGAILRM